MIEQNMLRERAKGLEPITEEKWQLVLEENREKVADFLELQSQLSPKSLEQYRSGLRQFFYYIYKQGKNKPIYEIKKSDFLRYFSYLRKANLSSSALKFKKSSVSTFCNYVENIVAEEDENYATFRNFTKAVTDIPSNKVYKKVKVTQEDYNKVMEALKESDDKLGMAWLSMAFMTGARKSELMQFRVEMLHYDKSKDGNFYESHLVRAKGRGEDGKVLAYLFNEEARQYALDYVNSRGYEHTHIFTTKYAGKHNVICESWANDFCNKVSAILDRRINPHILRASVATRLLESGADINLVSKKILHHSSVETTKLYDLRDENEGLKDLKL